MMFPDAESHSQWIHEFYEEHGDVIHNILTFGADPAIFTELSRPEP